MSALRNKNAGEAGVCFVPAFLACMNFHDTHFNIGDLPCKSQSCAKLGRFCANGMLGKMLSFVVSAILCVY